MRMIKKYSVYDLSFEIEEDIRKAVHEGKFVCKNKDCIQVFPNSNQSVELTEEEFLFIMGE